MKNFFNRREEEIEEYMEDDDLDVYFPASSSYNYLQSTPYWRWLGHLQAYAVAKDDNPESPFYINGTLGLIRLPLFGGDYDNCITDDLAQQRANYELYLHSQLPSTLSLSCVSVPWFDGADRIVPVLLDDQLNVKMTIKDGKVIYNAENR